MGGSNTWTLDYLIGMMKSRPVKMKSVSSCSLSAQLLARSTSDQSIVQKVTAKLKLLARQRVTSRDLFPTQPSEGRSRFMI